MKFSAYAESEMKEIPHAPQRISHAAGVFHLRSKFHKSRKGFISLKRNRLCLVDKGGFFSGAGGRTRTGTVSLPMDFESITSANSIMAANSTIDIIAESFCLVKSFFDFHSFSSA